MGERPRPMWPAAGHPGRCSENCTHEPRPNPNPMPADLAQGTLREVIEGGYWHLPSDVSAEIIRVIEEVATCHRLIARADECVQRGGPRNWRDFLPPDEARVLDTVRAGGDEEKAT